MEDHRNPDLAATPFIAELRRRYNELAGLVGTIVDGPQKQASLMNLGFSLDQAQTAALLGVAGSPVPPAPEPELPPDPGPAPAEPPEPAAIPKKGRRSKRLAG